MTNKGPRVAVLIDYPDMCRVGGGLHAPTGSEAAAPLDPVRLAQRLVDGRNKRSQLAAVRVVRGRPHHHLDPAAFRAYRDDEARWKASCDVLSVIPAPMAYPADFPARPARPEGIPTLLTTELFGLLSRGGVHIGILASHDQALTATVQAAALNGQRVEVAAWAGYPFRLRLPDDPRRPWCHWLTEDDYRAAAVAVAAQ